MRICYVVAMVAEAQPFIERYGIKQVENFFAPLPSSSGCTLTL